MPTHSKPDRAVTVLLQKLNDEVDHKKMKDMHSKMQSSVRGRLGPRVDERHTQISDLRGGGKFCGLIFMCNRRTWKECLGQSLFGLPIGRKSLVKQVSPGMKLFLFEYDRRQLWGVFEAASYGCVDIIPNAYTGGSFPCQVRVKVPEDCVALYEEEFREAIRDNYYSLTKFHFDLSEKQVCHLTSLFERKYLSANIMHSNLLKYEEKRHISGACQSNGGLPLLLTDKATCFDLLQHSWYASSCQVTKRPCLFNSEKGRDHSYKNGESRSGCKTSEKASSIFLPNGTLDIFQSNVASVTGELDFATGDTIVFPDDVSYPRSDRPTVKSVWSRISGCSKSSVKGDSIRVKKSPEVIPVITPPKACTKVKIDGEDESFVQDKDVCRVIVSEEAAEEYSVGFKRRRARNNNEPANVDGTPSKQRRKLTRPSFEVVPDGHLVEQGKYVAEKTTLRSTKGALDFSKSSSTVGMVEGLAENIAVPTELPMDLDSKVWDVSKFPLSDPEDWNSGMSAPGCKEGNLQSVHNVYLSNTLDLNFPVEPSIPNNQGVAIDLDNSLVPKGWKQCTTDATVSKVSGIPEAAISMKLEQHTEPLNERGPNSLVCETQQEPCCLALSLATPETVLRSREGIDNSNIADESFNGDRSGESTSISLSCTSGRDLLNQVDLKSVLSGLQVSGIKLQLGASPCLILQLGDLAGSASTVDSQDLGRDQTPG